MEWNEQLTRNVPYGWCAARLGDVCTFRNGINYEKIGEHDFEEIILCCALGGRLDHTLGNIQAASYAALKGLKVTMPSQNDRLYFLSNSSIELKRCDNHSLSLFALTEKADGVNATCVKYPLKDALFYNHSTLGVSNEWLEDKAFISVGNGVLLVVLSKMN